MERKKRPKKYPRRWSVAISEDMFEEIHQKKGQVDIYDLPEKVRDFIKKQISSVDKNKEDDIPW